ncbi:metallophosphoesterase [Bacillus sp. DNRA2]|uniref:metallophosphoesterase n=1 Tax=Bacillus sp. DNRA2 TaxID=2723053 RepID=UPI00145E0568|nr:metallophosphoesterase [Bacillus sp. DNRA2]NMD71131.1 metallophosphoesterase [Bacillus sp. DNRA2]
MKITIILAVILTIIIYGLLCYYIGRNGWILIKNTTLTKYKKSYITLIVFLSLSLFFEIMLPYRPLQWISGYWMAILSYSILILPLANLLYFLLKKKYLVPISIGVIGVYFFIFLYGTYNAWTPTVRNYTVEINKRSDLKDLKIFMASDIHLGQLVGKNHLERLVDLVNTEKPDIVLLPGDLINDNIEPYLKQNMGEVLGKVDAPLGVYAVLGNHDYYGGDKDDIISEMNKLGIHVLMDDFIKIQDFYLVGRKEHTDNSRIKLNDYLNKLDKNRPIIMMDHQPKDLKEAEEFGVDILLSGHTHRGQLWPANLLTHLIYENDYGYLKKGELHSLVSSGFGLWGPPLRIGTQAEAMVIEVKFVGK